MKLVRFLDDLRGATAVEFGLSAPAFLFLVFGIIEGGFMLWTQFSLQHGVEMAARCGSVNKILCPGTTAIQSYASSNAYGLNPPTSTFSVSTPSCGTQVSASYAFPMVTGLFGSMTLTAQSCFPK